MIKAIFFDFDGVLTIDSNGKAAIFRNFETKVPNVSPEKIRECFLQWNEQSKCGKVAWENIWDEFCACLGIEASIDILDDVWGIIRPNNEMFDIARMLKDREYTTGIITSNSVERMSTLRVRHNLELVFDHIVTSGDVGSTKSESKIFETALEMSGFLATECAFVDNHEGNLVVPKDMGFQTYFHDHEKNDVEEFRTWLQKQGVSISS